MIMYIFPMSCTLYDLALINAMPYSEFRHFSFGSILGHGSIVAREYGIPAVLGTGNCTQIIRDGDMITVDGSRGIVTIAQ